MAIKSKSLFTEEEELLLQDFNMNISTKSCALFYGNAFLVSTIPIWLFWRMLMIDIYSSTLAFIVVTLLSTYLVAFAYKNTKFTLKPKIAYHYYYYDHIAIKKEGAIPGDINRKRMSKKLKEERILWGKNEVADYEATIFSIFYNNALFLALVIFISFYALKTFSPSINYIFSLGTSGLVLVLLSTGKY